jgi:hypothetical protein
VRTINFEDVDPSLGTSYDVNLLDSINANWYQEIDPKPTLHTLSRAQTSHLPRTDPPDEDDLLFYDALKDAPIKDMPLDI